MAIDVGGAEKSSVRALIGSIYIVNFIDRACCEGVEPGSTVES